jgi:hypothetical protein
MLGLPSSANVLKGLEDPNTDSTSCLFIEKGHIVEYIEMNSKKIVCLFFGPGEGETFGTSTKDPILGI